ncbi:hypothetical protein L1987_28491 [Smallanthus sonchifolius]|uniref:Uncharacterized protein n=1 Tax=Smallanthus sonchifolius TaxID=185202 RepID=A0ACB9HYK5_9ASTR|nr:hypothetical protein L1987_28491 [Smallanthus sonchifolius]
MHGNSLPLPKLPFRWSNSALILHRYPYRSSPFGFFSHPTTTILTIPFTPPFYFTHKHLKHTETKMGFRGLFSVLLLTSCFTINVFGGGIDLDRVIWTQAPHHAPSYPPVGAPAPHHHHHKRPGGHHHKPAVPPTAHPPSVAPVHPPTKAPVHPPTKAPVHPPTKAPVHPPTKAPVHPPTKAPVHPPTKAPVHPPTKAPVHPPSVAPVHSPLPVRRQVAIRGMVYCKACKYRGVDTLLAASPLQGAEVLLTCNNTKYPLRVKGTTDKNGFFFIMPPKTLTTFGAHKCKVTLLSSPKATCNHPTNLHYGVKGATLIPTPKPFGSKLPLPPLPFDVFTVGPFAYEASKKTICPR